MEIIIVIALLGILAAITGPSIKEFQKTYHFTNSVKMVEDALDQGFSESRTQSKNKTFQAQKKSSQFLFGEASYSLFGNIVFLDDVSVEFQAPFGDITQDSSALISLSNGKKQATFVLHKSSGLIDLSIGDHKQPLETINLHHQLSVEE